MQNVAPQKNRADLFWVSALALFVELLLIRWLATEIRAFTIFKNFPLIACYVGLGMGFMAANKNGRLLKIFPYLLLALVALILSADRTGLTHILMPGLAWGGLQTAWLDAAHPPAISSLNLYIGFSIFTFFLLLILVALTMSTLGQRLGQLFDQGTPLQSYLVNLLGSALGIAAFSILSLIGTPPLVWVIVCCLLSAWIFRSKSTFAILIAIVALTIVMPTKNIFASQNDPAHNFGTAVLWSPYHRVDLAPSYIKDGGEPDQKGPVIGYQISANKGYFQQALNLSDAFISSLSQTTKKQLEDFRFDQYDLPYQFYHPRKVLIMGSGTGNDVAAALRHGVEHIDAVEIDPLIVRLGRKLHPEHPYDSPKVRVEVNDARAFLRNNKEKYDLVMTGFLDSHTVAGNSLSVRLDDYVYTVEGMRDAMAHLSPGGLYSITYCAVNDFISKRLIANIRAASEFNSKSESNEKSKSNTKPDILVLKKPASLVWHLFAPASALINASLPQLTQAGYENFSHLDTSSIRCSTDDWPFLYLKPMTVDPLYLLINLGIILLGWAICGKSIIQNYSARRLHLLFLGAAFLLLELAVIDRLALVFGSTWLVNSICIFTVLLAIITANIITIKYPTFLSLTQKYLCLLAGLLIVYLTPLQSLNILGMWLGGSIAATISAIPVFFAGLIFSYAFSQEKKSSVGLAFNMFGAVLGGLVEYVATYTGIRSLLVIAFLLYSISWWLWNFSLPKKASV